MTSVQPKPDSPLAVNLATLADALSLSEARIGQLVREGVVVKLARGRYDLVPSVKGYLNFLRARTCEDIPTLKAELLREQIKKAKTENGRVSGELIPATVIGDFIRENCLKLNQLLTIVFETEAPPACQGKDIAAIRMALRDCCDRVRDTVNGGLRNWTPEIHLAAKPTISTETQSTPDQSLS
ncbi:MAG: hypothetical protein JNJ82_15410 [Opitutaceae bacterium]|nr:hypothetical protein [Opitutaceae bacterium]